MIVEEHKAIMKSTVKRQKYTPMQIDRNRQEGKKVKYVVSHTKRDKQTDR